MRFAWTGCDLSMYRNLNIWDVFQMNKVQMRQSLEGRWRVGGGLQVLQICGSRVLRSSLSEG